MIPLFGAYVGFQFVMTLYLQTRNGWSPVETALAFLPAGLLVAVGAPRMGPLATRFGTATLITAGLLSLPALSAHVPDADCPAPSLLSTTGSEHSSIPDRASAPLNVTVTSVLFQPFALAAGDAEAEASGAVLSMLMPVTSSPLLLPAKS